MRRQASARDDRSPSRPRVGCLRMEHGSDTAVTRGVGEHNRGHVEATCSARFRMLDPAARWSASTWKCWRAASGPTTRSNSIVAACRRVFPAPHRLGWRCSATALRERLEIATERCRADGAARRGDLHDSIWTPTDAITRALRAAREARSSRQRLRAALRRPQVDCRVLLRVRALHEYRRRWRGRTRAAPVVVCSACVGNRSWSWASAPSLQGSRTHVTPQTVAKSFRQAGFSLTAQSTCRSPAPAVLQLAPRESRGRLPRRVSSRPRTRARARCRRLSVRLLLSIGRARSISCCSSSERRDRPLGDRARRSLRRRARPARILVLTRFVHLETALWCPDRMDRGGAALSIVRWRRRAFVPCHGAAARDCSPRSPRRAGSGLLLGLSFHYHVWTTACTSERHGDCSQQLLSSTPVGTQVLHYHFAGTWSRVLRTCRST